MKKNVVEGKKLPWSTDGYRALEPGDLKPVPAPTPEQRIRVAAALATIIRDSRMTGRAPAPNAETIRSVLVMDAKSWERDIPVIAGIAALYDPEDPRVRFDQIRRAYS